VAFAVASTLVARTPSAGSRSKPRARYLGIPFGTPGPLNAITDVANVEVGFTTLISGEGKGVVGQGLVRSGVTAILPRGKASNEGAFAAFYSGNGNGDMTGTHWVEENGVLERPIMITNTRSVAVVRDAAIEWMVNHDRPGTPLFPRKEQVPRRVVVPVQDLIR
jgi:D-aminopeptidase